MIRVPRLQHTFYGIRTWANLFLFNVQLLMVANNLLTIKSYLRKLLSLLSLRFLKRQYPQIPPILLSRLNFAINLRLFLLRWRHVIVQGFDQIYHAFGLFIVWFHYVIGGIAAPMITLLINDRPILNILKIPVTLYERIPTLW